MNQKTISTNQLIESVSKHLDINSKDIKFVLDGVRDILVKELAIGNKVVLLKTFSLESRYYKAHQGTNPQNGQSITIPERNETKVKVSGVFNQDVNNLRDDVIDFYE